MDPQSTKCLSKYLPIQAVDKKIDAILALCPYLFR